MEKEAVMAPHREVYKNMKKKKKTKQMRGTSLFTKSSVSSSTRHCTLFSHSEHSARNTDVIPVNTKKKIFLCLLLIKLDVIKL
jgi:hypothetical protein